MLITRRLEFDAGHRILRGTPKALELKQKALGAEELMRMPSPDGKAVLIGETAARMRLVDLGTGDVKLLPGDAGSVVSVAWSADGQTVAAGTFEGFIKLWNMRTRREMAALHGHISMVTALEFSRDGLHLVSGSYDGTWRVWSAPARRNSKRSSPN